MFKYYVWADGYSPPCGFLCDAFQLKSMFMMFLFHPISSCSVFALNRTLLAGQTEDFQVILSQFPHFKTNTQGCLAVCTCYGSAFTVFGYCSLEKHKDHFLLQVSALPLWPTHLMYLPLALMSTLLWHCLWSPPPLCAWFRSGPHGRLYTASIGNQFCFFHMSSKKQQTCVAN